VNTIREIRNDVNNRDFIFCQVLCPTTIIFCLIALCIAIPIVSARKYPIDVSETNIILFFAIIGVILSIGIIGTVLSFRLDRSQYQELN
jgi:hypothetical protein